jgi:hypothetical protein
MDPSSSRGDDDMMREWPNGKQILRILFDEGIAVHPTTEAYWQAAFRWSLLKKYGPCPTGLLHLLDNNKKSQQQKQSKDGYVTLMELSDQDIQTIHDLWRIQCDMAAADANGTEDDHDDEDDLRQFLTTGMSNGRPLQWSMIDCGPACQFQLHAHPNIEVIYAVQGALHEIRMEGPPVTKTFVTPPKKSDSYSYSNNIHNNNIHTNNNKSNDKNNKEKDVIVLQGPDLSYLKRPWKFSTLLQGEFLVNEVGSIHKSFTATNDGNGVKLLTLWGGSHADVAHHQMPTTVNVQRALESMDERLQSCNNCRSTWQRLQETFLPIESERS